MVIMEMREFLLNLLKF